MPKMTGIYQCPGCSRAITYRSTLTRLNVCACGSVLNRLESDDLVQRSHLIIFESNDLLRPGAKGKYQGRSFEVLGRFRLWLDESVFNYWTIMFSDQTMAMLGEGYGIYCIMERTTLDMVVKVDDLMTLGKGNSLNLKTDNTFYLQRKDLSWKFEVEGEVWVPECQEQLRTFECYSPEGGHIILFEYLPDFLAAYQATYIGFGELELTSLSEKPLQARTFQCTQCHNEVRVKTFPYAQSCSCSCGARLVFKSGQDFRANGKDKEDQNLTDIPLGSQGVIKGISYEVIGYAQKEEIDGEGYRWKEYVLFNRAEGYAFLSEYEGNWLYAREMGDSPVLAGDDDPTGFVFRGEEFQLYNRYRIRLIDTAGEFPYNIYDDGNIYSAEYIFPPKMWIFETSREEGLNWFLAEHVEHATMVEQFPFDLPTPVGKGVLDPRGFTNQAVLIKLVLLAVGAMLLVHFLIGMTKQEKLLLDKTLQFADSSGNATVVSPPFKLDKWRSNLSFHIDAPVDNSWMDVEAALVNAGTGSEYDVEQAVEYYHGYEDGESWDEGSPKETAWLNSVPSGNYFLRIHALRDTSNSLNGGWNADTKNTIHVVVHNDVRTDKNLLIFLGVLLIWPAFVLIRMRIYQQKRWDGSPYSPYKKSDD